MKKSKKQIDDEYLSMKLIKLMTLNEIDEANCYINIIFNKIEYYENEKKEIYKKCKFWFQKKKTYSKINEIDKKIFEECGKIEKEIDYISKLINPLDELK